MKRLIFLIVTLSTFPCFSFVGSWDFFCLTTSRPKNNSEFVDFLIDGKTVGKNQTNKTVFSKNVKIIENILDVGVGFIEGIQEGVSHLVYTISHPHETIAGILNFFKQSTIVLFRFLHRVDAEAWHSYFVDPGNVAAFDCASCVVAHTKILWHAFKQMSLPEIVKQTVAIAVEFYLTGKCLHFVEKFVQGLQFQNILASRLALSEATSHAIAAKSSLFSHSTEGLKFITNHGRHALQSALRSFGLGSRVPWLQASVPLEYAFSKSPLFIQYNFMAHQQLDGSMVMGYVKTVKIAS